MDRVSGRRYLERRAGRRGLRLDVRQKSLVIECENCTLLRMFQAD